jgi:hypothetical protein
VPRAHGPCVGPPSGYGRVPTGTGRGRRREFRRERAHPVPAPTVRSPYVWGGEGVGSQIRRRVRRPVTVAAMMTRMAATMMLMIHRIQSMPFVASTPNAAAT